MGRPGRRGEHPAARPRRRARAQHRRARARSRPCARRRPRRSTAPSSSAAARPPPRCCSRWPTSAAPTPSSPCATRPGPRRRSRRWGGTRTRRRSRRCCWPTSRTLRADVVVSTIPAEAQTAEVLAAVADVPVVFDVVYDPWPTPLAAAPSRDRTDARRRPRPAALAGGGPGACDDRALRRTGRGDARRGRGGTRRTPPVTRRRPLGCRPWTRPCWPSSSRPCWPELGGFFVPALIGRIPPHVTVDDARGARPRAGSEVDGTVDATSTGGPTGAAGAVRRHRAPARPGLEECARGRGRRRDRRAWRSAGPGRSCSGCRSCRCRSPWPSSTGGPACCPRP